MLAEAVNKDHNFFCNTLKSFDTSNYITPHFIQQLI